MIKGFALLVCSAVLSFTAAASEPKWTEREVTIGEGKQTLYGSYIAPGPYKPDFDAVLIISGSGPTDRDGNQVDMKPDSLKMVAMAFGEAGIATLRVDKRGIAKSFPAGPREEDLRFETYIDDAKSWVAFLKAQPGVHRIFVLGHSEGALIGAVVAQSPEISGYISLAGAGEKAADAIRRQIAAQSAIAAELAEPTLKKLEAGEIDPNPNPALGSFFRLSLQPYLISWFRYDPKVEIAKIGGKVAIVQGTHDMQILVADAEMLHAAKPDAAYTLIDGMNHVLKIAPEDPAGNIATYKDPTLPLAPGLVDALLAGVTAP